MKKFLIIFFILTTLLLLGRVVHAQNIQLFRSNQVVTRVGNAPENERPSIGGGIKASCPIPGGKISTPSYQADPSKGHCGGSYSFSCYCGTNGRRAKAIDITTGGKDVVLPQIGGKDVGWILTVKGYPIEGGEGGGLGYTFKAVSGSDTWYIDMLHLGSTNLEQGKEYASGTAVAKSVILHTHVTIGKNLKEPVLAGSVSDCDPGWLPSDFICQ